MALETASNDATTETKRPADLLTEKQRKDGGSTAGLTLAAVPTSRAFDSSGTAQDPALIKRAAEQRAVDLGSKRAPGEDLKSATAQEDTRRIVVETDKSGAQTATTVIAEEKQSTTTTDAVVTGVTGQTCKQSGDYICTEHAENSIPMAQGKTFPPCSFVNEHEHGATWRLVKS